ncbi:MAG: MBL fold metallo-hydrolase [Pseudomonadota bacterium]
MKGTLTILGCGGSGGVPLIGNRWLDCDPSEPKNRRTRCSAAITTDKTTLVIDTGPDFSEQFNRENLNTPDAILYTHEHADHVAGIDELRVLMRLEQKTFDVYSNAETLKSLKERVGYMFESRNNGFYPAVCNPKEIGFYKDYTIGDISFSTHELDHTNLSAVGYRFGNVAYSLDFKRLDDQAIEALKGVDIWIADCLGYKSDGNPVHANLDEIYRVNEIIGAKEVYLSDMSPRMDYQTLLSELPQGYKPAYDGLQVEITWP